MKKFILSLLLCLTLFPARAFENPFSMDKNEVAIESQSTPDKPKVKFENPLTFDKDRFALSTLTFMQIWSSLGFIGGLSADLYARSNFPDTCFKDAAKLQRNFFSRPGALPRTLAGLTLWSAVCGATQGVQWKSPLPKFDEKPVLVNNPVENK